MAIRSEPARRMRQRGWRHKAVVLAVPVAAVLLFGGCDVQVEAGRQLPLSALDSRLVIGQSTTAEVAAALGPPFGRGRAMFPFHDAPRDSWTYYHERGDMSDGRRTFLWVFFNDGVYDGYIWFSSLPQP